MFLFYIDPNPLPEVPASCEYLAVGGDLTITSPVKPSGTHPPENVIESITAAAGKHFQDNERQKMMWRAKNKKDNITDGIIKGDEDIGELLRKNDYFISVGN